MPSPSRLARACARLGSASTKAMIASPFSPGPAIRRFRPGSISTARRKSGASLRVSVCRGRKAHYCGRRWVVHRRRGGIGSVLRPLRRHGTYALSVSYPEAKVGFSGGLISSLVTRMPHKVAMEFILLGEELSAQRAYEVGFVNKVVPPGEHLDAAMAYAEKLKANAPMVLAMLKRFTARTLPKGPIELGGYRGVATSTLPSCRARTSRKALQPSRRNVCRHLSVGNRAGDFRHDIDHKHGAARLWSAACFSPPEP